MTIEILQGLLVAVILSLFALVWHASKPKLAVLGRVPNSIDFSNIRHHPENVTIPGLLMVRPENGVFFANAAGIREDIMHEVEASAVPVRQVLIDLVSTSDLDAPGADMLIELHKELRERDVRFILTHMMTATRQVLERADTKHEISPQDICHSAVQAYMDYFVSDSREGDRQALLRVQLLETRAVLHARMSGVPSEHQATIAAVLDAIDKEVKQIEGG